MSETVLPQLQAVISDLEAEESNLAAQLSAIQTKKEAVLSVMDMFGEPAADSTSTATASSVEEIEAPTKTPTEPPAEKQKPATTVAKAETKTKAEAKTKAKTRTKAKSRSKAKKKDGRAADWQKYTLPGVADQPMPEAVKLILSTRPDEDFKIAEVMSGLFKESMPKAQYLKARNRISNILSGGVRSGDWFKGERGTYRLNEAG